MEQNELELEAAVFRRLLEHLDGRADVQNIDLMIAAGFCRNCLADWYREAAEARGIDDRARMRRASGSTASLSRLESQASERRDAGTARGVRGRAKQARVLAKRLTSRTRRSQRISCRGAEPFEIFVAVEHRVGCRNRDTPDRAEVRSSRNSAASAS